MKKKLLLLTFTLSTIFIFSQRMSTDNYELFLINLEENVVSISEGLHMTKNKQSFYEGSIEVLNLEDGAEKTYTFFFSTWDDKFKEFIIKDSERNNITPIITFKDKKTAIIEKEDKKKYVDLFNNATIENSILSSMVVWLDNQ